jgi:hypothetical protein
LIGKNIMMVPRFEGFSFDSDGLLRFKNWIYVLTKQQVEDAHPKRGS